MSGPKKSKPWENNYQVDTEESKPWEKKYDVVKKKDISETISAPTSDGTKSDSQSESASSGTQKTPENYRTGQDKKLSFPISKPSEKVRDEKLNAEIDSQYPIGSIAWSQEKLKANVPGYTSVYEDFKKTEKVDDAKIAQIAQEVEDEENEKGFFNTVKGTLSRAFSKLPTFLGGTTGKDAVPLYKEKEQAKKILQQEALLAKSQKKPIPQITQEAITQKAKEIAVDKRVKSQSDSQVRDLLKSYESNNPDKKDALLKYSALEKASLGEKDKLLVGKQNLLRSEIDNSINTIKEYNSQIKELSEKGVAIPDELKAEYENEATKYQSLLNDAIETQNQYISNTKKLGNINDNIDIFKRDYGWINNFVGNIDATLSDLTSGLAGAIDYGINVKSKLLKSPKLDAMDTPIRELAKGVAKDLKADSEERRSGLMKPISVEDINTPSDFGTWFSNTVLANQVPIFATVATGAPGIATLGASATGSKFEEMQSDGQEYSSIQQIGIPLAFGATETASAIVDKMLLGNASRVIRSATAPERKLIADGVWKGIMENMGEVLKGGLAEGLDESGTQIAQNIIDKYAGDKKNVEIFDNVKDAGYAGAIMGIMIPFSSSIVSQAVKPFNTDNKISKATEQLNRLESQLDNPNLTEDTRNIIAKQAEKAKYNLENLLKTKVQDIEAMPDGQFQEIMDIEKSQSKLKNQAREIQSDDSIDQGTKEQIISGLKEEFDQIEKRRTDLLERGPNAILSSLDEEEVIRLKDQASRDLLKELNPDGTKSITLNDKQISKKAVEIYNKEQSKNKKTDEQANNIEEQKAQPQTEEQTQVGEVVSQSNNSQISNETASPTNTASDGNVQPSSGIVEKGRTAEQQGSSGEIVQEANNTRTNPESVKIKLSEKGEEYNVTFSNGRLDISNNNGSEPSAPTRRKIEEKYSESIDFTKGDLAPATSESVDMNSYIADTSNNPAEVALTLLSIDNKSFIEENVSHKDRVIAENIGKVKRQSFIDNGDANYINRSIAKSYFNNEGASLDTLAQEMSEIAGVEITEQDIVDFILENPNGPQSFFSKAKREAREPLQKRFSALTGLPASDKFLQKAIEQQTAKEYFLNNIATEVLLMSDKELISLQDEINKSYEQEERTVTSTEGKPGVTDSEGSTEKSRIQEESGRSNSKEKESKRLNSISKENFDKLIKRLSKAFPRYKDEGTIVTTESELRSALDRNGISFKEFKNGQSATFQSEDNSRKEKQLSIINRTNPAPNSYNTWIRSVEDILTGEEAFRTAFEEGEMYPDFSTSDMQEALNSGEVTIYSSKPIKEGVFATPSRMNAEEYAGGPGSKIYSKTIKINDLAWIDESEGQYAPLKYLKTSDGTIYGAVLPDGTIYLNSEKLNANSPIHEFSHLWIELAEKFNKDLFNKGIDLIKGTSYLNKVQQNKAYKDLTEEQQLKEALAVAIGDKGELFVSELTRSKFRKFLEALKSFLSDNFFINKKNNIDELTLNQFIDGSLNDLLGGKEIVLNAFSEVEINLSKDLKLDQFIQNLDRAIEKLDEFGKENLGINIPLVVARQALNAMKVAAQTASTVADIISAGLNAVKKSDWYKNLSSKEKKDLEANFTDYLNKPFKTSRKKSRFKIEEEVESELQNGTSEKDILDQYYDRREKMIATDYLQRKKSVTETQAKDIVENSFRKADDLLKNNKTLSEKISVAFRKMMSKIVDRQFVPKFVLNKAGGRLVRNYLIATKGASGYARMIYDEAHEKIYKGLTSNEIKTLDKVIQLRRFISIDENRAKKNLPAVVHPDYINENIAKKYLEVLEKEIGAKSYSDMLSRSDEYFNTFKLLLDEMYKSGIISKESRDQFFDIDYQPRMFLEFLKKSEDELGFEIEDTASLSDKQIKKLEDGLDTSLVTDSQYLLSRSINIRTKSIAMNNTNKKLAEFIESQKIKVDELQKKDNPTKKEKQTIKYFGELEKKIIPNPIVDFSSSGEPKYQVQKLPKGFRNAFYYINGVKQNLLMEENFHEQYYDNLKGFFNSNAKETAVLFLGVGLVKAIATGNNPTFFITNTPRDFMFISTFSDEYGKNVLLNMAKLAKDTFKGINDIRKSKDNFKNFIRYGGMMDFLKDQGKFKGNKGLKKLLNKVDNKTKERFGQFFDYATLSKLQTYSEIGFRMAVFNRSIKNQLKDFGFKDISEVTDQNTLDDIYTNAVASARSTMDFNQGGTVTKDADALIPYLNAATQGTRVMFDNFRERPLETTFRALQTATLLSSAAVGTSIALLSAYNDDDDNTGSELYLKALEGISKYEQTNYFIVFTGKRTSDGEFEYYRIAKAQQLTPFFSAAEGIMNDFMRNSVDYKGKSKTISNINFALSNNISPLEFSVTGNITKNPFVKAALSYSVGYDFFREQDLSYLKGKVPVQAEGFENKNVEDFYKKIGEEAGISPVRMKAAVESMITTPSTSPYVGFLYGGLDAMASDKEGKQILQKLGTDLARSTVKRAMKETSEFNRRLNSREEIQEQLIKSESETLKTKSKFKQLSDGLIDKSVTQKFVDNEIAKIEKENPFEAKRLRKMINDRLKNKNVSPYVYEIKYARSADHKALLLIQLFGDNLKNPNSLDKEDKKLYNDLLQVRAISKESMFEYQKMINKKTAD